jgi:Zn-dependent M32 family carboxypeptidase
VQLGQCNKRLEDMESRYAILRNDYDAAMLRGHQQAHDAAEARISAHQKLTAVRTKLVDVEAAAAAERAREAEVAERELARVKADLTSLRKCVSA